MSQMLTDSTAIWTRQCSEEDKQVLMVSKAPPFSRPQGRAAALARSHEQSQA